MREGALTNSAHSPLGSRTAQPASLSPPSTARCPVAVRSLPRVTFAETLRVSLAPAGLPEPPTGISANARQRKSFSFGTSLLLAAGTPFWHDITQRDAGSSVDVCTRCFPAPPGDSSAASTEGVTVASATSLLLDSKASSAQEAGSLGHLVRELLQGVKADEAASTAPRRKTAIPKPKAKSPEVGAALWAAPPARFRNPLIGTDTVIASSDALKRASLAMGPDGTSDGASRVLAALGLLMPEGEAAALLEASDQQQSKQRATISGIGPFASTGSSEDGMPHFPMPDGMSRQGSDLVTIAASGGSVFSLAPRTSSPLPDLDTEADSAGPELDEKAGPVEAELSLDPEPILAACPTSPAAAAAGAAGQHVCDQDGDAAPDLGQGADEVPETASPVGATAWWHVDAPAWSDGSTPSAAMAPAGAAAAAAASAAEGAEGRLEAQFARVLATALCEPAASCRLLFRPTLALRALVRKAAALSQRVAAVALASPAEACESLTDVVYPALLSAFEADDELRASGAEGDAMTEVAAMREFAQALGSDPDEAAKLLQAALATSAASGRSGAGSAPSSRRQALRVAEALLSPAPLDNTGTDDGDLPAGSHKELKAAFEAAGACSGSRNGAVAHFCAGLANTLALRLAILGAVARFDEMDPALEAKALDGAQTVAAAWAESRPSMEAELEGLPSEVRGRIERLDADLKAAAAKFGATSKANTLAWSTGTTIPSKILLGTWYPEAASDAASGVPSM